MKSMSNVDIYTITNELNNLLTGARVDKSFQPTKGLSYINNSIHKRYCCYEITCSRNR